MSSVLAVIGEGLFNRFHFISLLFFCIIVHFFVPYFILFFIYLCLTLIAAMSTSFFCKNHPTLHLNKVLFKDLNKQILI